MRDFHACLSVIVTILYGGIKRDRNCGFDAAMWTNASAVQVAAHYSLVFKCSCGGADAAGHRMRLYVGSNGSWLRGAENCRGPHCTQSLEPSVCNAVHKRIIRFHLKPWDARYVSQLANIKFTPR